MPATGPRTSEGKKASSKNAIRHGLFAADDLLMTHESKEHLEQYRDAVWAQLNPIGIVEQELTERIVSFYKTNSAVPGIARGLAGRSGSFMPCICREAVHSDYTSRLVFR